MKAYAQDQSVTPYRNMSTTMIPSNTTVEFVFTAYSTTTYVIFEHYQTGSRSFYLDNVLIDQISTAGMYSQRLNGTENERVGLAKSLSVMPGDSVNATVYVKYLDPDNENLSTAMNALISTIHNNSPAGMLVDGGLPGSTGGASVPFALLLDKSDDPGTAPKAYLNWLVFDRDYVLKDGGYVPMTETAREYGQDAEHEALTQKILIKEAGYVYLYLSNDNMDMGGDMVETYFDDFKVEHVKSPVIQSEDFYPFGLSFNSYSRENNTRNQYLFNSGSERQDELDLNIDLTQFRAYDPAMGRWWQLDTKPDQSSSLYAAFQNNPLKYNDPLGDTVKLPGATETFIKQYDEAANKLRENGVSGNLTDLENSPNVYNIVQNDGDGKDSKEGKGDSFENDAGQINWNPYIGLETDEGDILSPTTLLSHELDQAAKYDKDPTGSVKDIKTDDSAYDNKEEKRVITGSETRTARELGEVGPDQPSRKNHGGEPVRVKGPTSTTPIYEKRKRNY